MPTRPRRGRCRCSTISRSRSPRSSFCAVVGPSGCGKSTLTRLVSGLMKPNEGQVWLHNKLVTSPRPTVGMAFQNPVLLEWRTILQNVLLPLEIVKSPMSKAQATERAHHLLDLVGLTGFAEKRPSELSGGMRQRASLCRSIIHKARRPDPRRTLRRARRLHAGGPVVHHARPARTGAFHLHADHP